MSTDAEDRAAALEILEAYAELYGAPVLDSPNEVEPILDRCKRASRWVAETEYSVGQVIVPVIRNGYGYIVTQPGTAQSASKSYLDWPTTDGISFSEGSSDPVLTWEVYGSDDSLFENPYNPQSPNVYDLQKAVREVWALKMRKAVQFIEAGDLKFQQVWEHCKEMLNTSSGTGALGSSSSGWGQSRVIRA